MNLLAQQTLITDTVAVGFYGGYAVVAVALVVWLARTLQHNGEIFLENVFEDDGMAHAVNRLLVVGFYLLNLGYALLLYQVTEATALTEAFNGLVERLGLLLLSLGVIHLVNMLVFWRIRTYRDRAAVTPPAPTMITPPARPGVTPPPPAPTGAY